MRCPECNKQFHPQHDRAFYFVSEGQEEAKVGKAKGFGFLIQLCPACFYPLVTFQEGRVWESAGGQVTMMAVESEEVVYPLASKDVLPAEIPEDFKADFEEARSALEYSSKASAALSRRLLQRTLEEKLDIKRRDLSLEIDAFIETSGAPSYLTTAVDAVRNIGNFAAHPVKYKNSGEIVAVEIGEAEWLIEVIQSLFDFVFVQPARLLERRKVLDEKLSELGKPPLKG